MRRRPSPPIFDHRPLRLDAPAAVGAVALAAQIELDAALVARTLLLNNLGRAASGWLFWRHHLETAMASQTSRHLGLPAVQAA